MYNYILKMLWPRYATEQSHPGFIYITLGGGIISWTITLLTSIIKSICKDIPKLCSDLIKNIIDSYIHLCVFQFWKTYSAFVLVLCIFHKESCHGRKNVYTYTQNYNTSTLYLYVYYSLSFMYTFFSCSYFPTLSYT